MCVFLENFHTRKLGEITAAYFSHSQPYTLHHIHSQENLSMCDLLGVKGSIHECPVFAKYNRLAD